MSTSSERNTEPRRAGSEAAMAELGPDAGDEPPLEIIRTARAQLISVEITLRDLWYDTVDSGPELSARLNIAARLAHNAAEALSPQTLL